jgi:hypothetical protein
MLNTTERCSRRSSMAPGTFGSSKTFPGAHAEIGGSSGMSGELTRR